MQKPWKPQRHSKKIFERFDEVDQVLILAVNGRRTWYKLADHYIHNNECVHISHENGHTYFVESKRVIGAKLKNGEVL